MGLVSAPPALESCGDGTQIMATTQLLDIFLIAALAGIILFRLYTVLGRRTGHERPPQDNYRLSANTPRTVNDAPVAAADDKLAAHPGQDARPSDPVASELLTSSLPTAISTRIISYQGRAGPMRRSLPPSRRVIRQLRPLLSDDVYVAFDSAIRGREESGAKGDVHLPVSFKEVKIVSAALKGRLAEVTLAFSAQFISATTDAQGALLEGDAKSVRDVTDVWTFRAMCARAIPTGRLSRPRANSSEASVSGRQLFLTIGFFGLLCLVIVAGWWGLRPPLPGALRLTKTSFATLPGWDASDPRAALAAFQRSCEMLAKKDGTLPMGGAGYAGSISNWRAPCVAARSVSADAARGFFEHWFVPVAVSAGALKDGLLPAITNRNCTGAAPDTAHSKRPSMGCRTI